MPSERRQFRLLYRDFLRRIVDLEVLSFHGEVERLLGQFAAMLAAFSFTYVIFAGPKYLLGKVPAAQLRVAVSSDCEFLVGVTMAVAGLFAVLAWNTILPDRRDATILGLLPVRTRTVFLAKVAAVASALGVAVGAMNLFTGLTFPFLALPGAGGWFAALRSLAGYWIAMTAAGAFVCCSMLALQGVAAQLLPYRLFLRASSFLQLAAFFGVLAALFLEPPGTPSWLPSSWFFALQQQLGGAVAFHPLAGRAAWSLLGVCGLAAVSFALTYARSLRKIVEQPDILPAARRRRPRLTYALLPRPLDRAIVLFTARTIARSRQHRLILAAYAGIGLAIAFAYARDLLYGTSDPLAQSMARHWNQLNAPLLIAGVVLLCFAVAGARAIFSLPVALRANWVFQLTAIHSPATYFAAVRKALFAVAVLPIWIASAAGYFLVWPGRFAAQHMLVLTITALLLVHRALYQFRKIPFACSYLPGKSNLHVRIGVYGLGLVAIAGFGMQIEFAAMPHPVGFAVFCTVCLVVALWHWRRWREFVHSPYNWIEFEDLPDAGIHALDLHNPPSGPRTGPPPAGEAGVSIRPRSVLGLEGAVEPPVPVGVRVRMEQAFSDFRAGLRIFQHSPGFSAAAVALLAVGIGGNTAVYSLIHSVLDKPAPGVRAERLVDIVLTVPNDPNPRLFAFSTFTDFLSNSGLLESIAASDFERFALTTADSTYELRGLAVTRNYFDTLGVPIVRGRGFTDAEARGAGGLTAVIAWHVWQNQFQSASDIAGRQVLLNGAPVTIVGVAARRFRGTRFAPNFEIAVPFMAYARSRGRTVQQLAASGVEAIGRLAPGVSLQQAQGTFNVISARIVAEYPEFARHRIVVAPYSATSFGPWQSGQARMFMALLTGVALLTLLVVCANVANLMLGRSAARQRELAVRQSLGAPRGRIVMLLVSEGLALSLVAAAAAWGFAWWVSRAIPAWIPPLESGARIEPNFAPDWRVGIYALALAVCGALAFTLAPSLRSRRQDLLPLLKAGEISVVPGRSRMANVLVVVQIALCVLLLGGAGLAVRSTALINAADLGYPKNHRLALRLNTLAAGSLESRQALIDDLRKRIAAVPQVLAVSYGSAVPPDPFGQFLTLQGQTPLHGMVAGPRYLDALGVQVQGRDFSEADLDRDVAILTLRAAAESFGGPSVLGRTIDLFGRTYEVIGVAPNAAYSGLREQGGDQFVFVSRAPATRNEVRYFNIRYAGPLASVAVPIRGIIRDASISQRVVGSLQTMDSFMLQYTAPALVISSLLGVFSAGSLIVAGIGLYAVIAFHTARRTREFGIRLALGATPRHVLRTVFQEGLLLAAIGSAAGLLLSAVTNRLLSSLLFGVSPIDPLTWGGVIALLAAVSLTACYVPARRAGNIQPLEALRQD